MSTLREEFPGAFMEEEFRKEDDAEFVYYPEPPEQVGPYRLLRRRGHDV